MRNEIFNWKQAIEKADIFGEFDMYPLYVNNINQNIGIIYHEPFGEWRVVKRYENTWAIILNIPPYFEQQKAFEAAEKYLKK